MTDKTKNTSVRSRSLQYVLKFPGVTSIEVADALNISPANVSPALSELYAEGKLERQKIPGSHGAYAYFVPDRKPVASVKQLQPDLPWPGNAGLQGRYNEAKAIYSHVLGRDPDNAEAMSNLGICAACTGAPMVALKLMNQAVALEPHSAEYHNNLAELLRMMGRFAEAESVFRTSLRINPRDAGVLSTLGLTIAQQGRAEEGLRTARDALLTNPNLAAAHYRVGLILAMLRDFAAARASQEAALALDPNFGPARQALQQLPANAPG